ncbi:MAG TPA: SigE family RNA polymerase sigma factor [Mycobacteriales bacterium]|nr:SigE family RNA polymerase sigma factor [Mycobacteriales bacterium]
MPATADRVAELYRAHLPGATRLAYLLTGDRAAAEDVAQEAFLTAASRLGALRDPDAFGAYLHRAVVNRVRNRARRLRLERAHADTAGPAPYELPDVATRDRLWAALRRLTTRQRAALVLRFYLDLSEAETAERLGCRTGTVKSTVSRALAILRADLSTDEVLDA